MSSSSFSAPNSYKRGSVAASGTAGGSGQSTSKLRSRTQSEKIHRKRSSISIGANQKSSSSWNLKYKDFIFSISDLSTPSGNKSEKFSKLIEKANEWLRENNDVRVRTCETLTWMSHDPLRLTDSEQMVHTKRLTEGTYTYYARGLRLWLIATHPSQSQSQGQCQTLFCEDFVPSKSDLFQDLVVQVNKKINQRHIGGHVSVVHGRWKVSCWRDSGTVEARSLPRIGCSYWQDMFGTSHAQANSVRADSAVKVAEKNDTPEVCDIISGVDVMPLAIKMSGEWESPKQNLLKEIGGDILTIETLGSPKIRGRAKPNITFWSENVDDDAPYVFTLRVFSCRPVQQPSRSMPTIGVRDMIPLPTEDGFEGFEALTEKTSSWLKDQPPGTVLINMQSVLVQKQEGIRHAEIGSRCRYAMPGINNPDTIEFFRILRVCYAKPNSSAELATSSNGYTTSAGSNRAANASGSGVDAKGSVPPSSPRKTSASGEGAASGLRDSETVASSSSGVHGHTSSMSSTPSGGPIICYETFTPELVQDLNEEESATGPGQGAICHERLEKMRETFSKVIAFLRNTGADLICAETVMNPAQLYNSADQSMESEDEIKFLFTIRLFVMGPVGQYTNTSRLVRRMSSNVNMHDSIRERQGNKHQSSPLFLASVVNRRFKYRWLVLAISAFTCMAIITTLSVVYSNK